MNREYNRIRLIPMSATAPIRPNAEPEDEKIIREREKTFDQDEKLARPWQEVRERILNTPVPR